MKLWSLTTLMILAFVILPALAAGTGCDNAAEVPGPFVKGKPAPDFTLNDLKGQPVTLSALRGSVVMLNFWIPTQPSSMEQLSEIAVAWGKLKSRGLAVISISPVGSERAVLQSLTGKPYLWPFVIDADGSVAKVYGMDTVSAMPVSIFITPTGKYDSQHSGGTLTRLTIEQAFGFAQRGK
jgi:hypothetical protein